MKSEFACKTCGKNFLRYVYENERQPKFRFCSKICKNECKELFLWSKERKKEFSEKIKGDKNPNFGKKWTEEQRQHLSKISSERMTLEVREEIGRFHRGKKMSEESRKKMSESHKGKKPYEMTDEIRKKIGNASSEKFTDEFKIKMRLIGEKNGTIIPLEKKDDYKFYFELSSWNRKMFDLIDDEQQVEDLRTNGIFNVRNNKRGLVRDHIFSRKDGFENGVFPEILRHPTNCRLISHGSNVSKRSKSHIALEVLFENIENYKNEWHEQELCKNLIKRFKNGERYDKKFYIDNFYSLSRKV